MTGCGSLGIRSARLDRPLKPAIPVGWLLSITLRHIHRKQSTDKPAEAWETAVKLAVDFAASMDCQRYNQFDRMSLYASDFFSALGESLKWRELFTLPQVPPSALTILRDAFSQIVWPGGLDDLRSNIDRLFGELDVLLKNLSVDSLCNTTVTCEFGLPASLEYARACQGAANASISTRSGRMHAITSVSFFSRPTTIMSWFCLRQWPLLLRAKSSSGWSGRTRDRWQVT